ncbi:DUF3306 domain-containing protein [Massilia aerilata]|uniref:DUF3306 domain-containing protein n=1 Tax=Massilia aerilata TaxID=453817 RepID=A0ABW0RW93_9BURK
MADEGFLRRWARRKNEVREGRAPAPEPVAEAPLNAAAFAAPAAEPVQAPLESAAEPRPLPAERPLPTMDDVAALKADSDFSGFVARGVDQAVRRSALKKLFADPHFNVMDRLDVYIDDYNKPSPMSEAMLASLNHAKSTFMTMVEDEPAVPETTAEAKAEPQPEQPPEQETQ